MAVLIPAAIGPKSFELVRDRIGAILTEELASQASIIPDPSLVVGVFVERFKLIDHTELPLVFVNFSGGSYEKKTVLSQTGVYQYTIDCYEKAKTTPTGRGDTAASFKAQRLAGVVQAILENQAYITLGFAPPFIEHTEVSSILMASPQGVKDAENIIMCRVVFSVRVPETNNTIVPLLLAGHTTQVFLEETELGYRYELPVPVLDDFLLLEDGFFLLLEDGSKLILE